MQSRVIKLADLIHNTQSITRYDQKFAAQYLAEKAGFLCCVLFTDAEIGVGEEIESRTGDHPLIEAEKTVATALSASRRAIPQIRSN